KFLISIFENIFVLFFIFFFFSSRRRHTRSKRDWSSDVCSSDLSFQRSTVVIEQYYSLVAMGMDYSRNFVHSFLNEQSFARVKHDNQKPPSFVTSKIVDDLLLHVITIID